MRFNICFNIFGIFKEKTYKSLDEEIFRYTIFVKNIENIRELNEMYKVNKEYYR